jgi:hypothetical protein
MFNRSYNFYYNTSIYNVCHVNHWNNCKYINRHYDQYNVW